MNRDPTETRPSLRAAGADAHCGGTAKWLTPSARGTIQVTVQVLLGAALFAVLQALASAHNLRFDLTPTKSFILSDASRQVAAGLEDEVRITAFYNSQERGRRREIGDLLQRFRDASDRISYRLADLDRAPGLAQKLGVSSYNTGAAEGAGRVLELESIDEAGITSALLTLSRRAARGVCFLSGHGERSPERADDRESVNEVALALERESFTTQTLATIPLDGLPAECWIAVLAGPSHELLPGEARLLGSHVRAGGRLMVLLDQDAPESVIELLRGFGIEVGEDLVVDERKRLFGADRFTVLVPIFDKKSFGDRLEAAAVFPLARSVRPREGDRQPGTQVSTLAMSSPKSWAHAIAGAVPDADDLRFREEIDQPGPVPVGVLATLEADDSREDGARTGRVAAFGDSDFATNLYFNLLGNKDLFMSTVALLAEEPELIAVRHRGRTGGTLSPIALTAGEGRVIFWVAVVAQPAVFLLAGLFAVLAQRRRHGGR